MPTVSERMHRMDARALRGKDASKEALFEGKKSDIRDIEARSRPFRTFVIVRRAGPTLLTAFQYFLSFKGGGGRGTQVLLDGGLGGGRKMARWGGPRILGVGVGFRSICASRMR